ncbi:MAG: hypothetical protein ACJ746_30135, partial [Bryobacteraceae bacterium]
MVFVSSWVSGAAVRLWRERYLKRILNQEAKRGSLLLWNSRKSSNGRGGADCFPNNVKAGRVSPGSVEIV